MQPDPNKPVRRRKLSPQRIVFGLIVCFSILTVSMVFWGKFVSIPLIKNLFEREVSKVLSMEVTFEKLNFNFLPLGVVLDNIEITKQKGPLEYAQVGRIETVLRLRPLFLGKVVLKNVVIDQPVIHLTLANPKVEEEKEKPGFFENKSFALSTIFDDSDVPVELEDLQILDATLKMSLPKGFLLHLNPKQIQFQHQNKVQTLLIRAHGSLEKDEASKIVENIHFEIKREENKIHIQKFEIHDQNNTLVAEGVLHPELDLHTMYSGSLQAIEDFLQAFALSKNPLDAQGLVSLQSHFTGSFENVKSNHELKLSNILVKDRAVDQIQAIISMDEGVFKNAEVSILYDKTRAQIVLEPSRTKGQYAYSVSSDQLFFEHILGWIEPEMDPIVLADTKVRSTGTLLMDPFKVAGDLDVQFKKTRFNIPENVLEFVPLELRNVDIGTKFSFDQKNGIRFDEGKLKNKSMTAEFYIHILPDQKVEGDWEIQMKDVKGLFEEGYPAQGRGKVLGSIRQDKELMRLEFNYDFKNFEYEEFGKHDFKGTIAFENDKSIFENMKIQNKQGALLDFNGFASEEEFEVKAKFADFNLGWIGRIIERRYKNFNHVKGFGSGSVELRGHDDRVDGVIELGSQNAHVLGVATKVLDGKFTFDDQDIKISKLEIRGDPLRASAKGTIKRESFSDLTIDIRKLPLDVFGLSSVVTSIVDFADAKIILNGDFENPAIDLDSDLFLKIFHPTEPYVEKARFTASGMLSELDWQIMTIEPGLELLGKYRDMQEKSWIEFSGKMEEFPILSLLKNVNSRMTGAFEASGFIEQFDTWDLNLNLSEFAVYTNQVEFYNKNPFHIQMKQGNLQVQDLTFGNQTHELSLSGSVSSDQSLNFQTTGRLPFGILSLLPIDLQRVEGALDVNIRLIGSFSNPTFQGNMQLKGGYLRHEVFPHPLEAIEMSLGMDQNVLRINYMDATMGGGTVNAEGDFYLSSNVEDIKVFIGGTVQDAQIRFPDYLPVLIQGPFALEGNLMKPLLKTDFEVISGMYTDQWDWQSQILTFGAEREAERIYFDDEESLLLDMRFFTNNQNFLVRNDIALARVVGDIIIRGSNLNFGMIGSIEVIDGQVWFLENNFELLPGVVNFVREDDIVLSFNLNARTRIGNTDIILDIRTEDDEVRAYLSSIPPKEETKIIALLTLGVELDDLAVSSAAMEDGVSAALIPNILSGPVQSRLQSGLKKIKLVDSFQFIPYFSEDTKTTGLKLFVSKNLLSRMRLTYATDLFEIGNENTVTLEQFLSDRISLQGSFRDNKEEANQDVDVGLDFEFRTEF